MFNIRKTILIIFSIILGLSLSFSLLFLMTPYPTIQLFRFSSRNIEYINPNSKSYKQLKFSIQKDISYNSIDSNGYLDIYEPINDLQTRPTIIWVHGGTYVSGDKSDLETYLPYLANEGFVVFSINYELAPKATFPSPIKQLTEAFEYIIANESKYKIDINNIFISGDSVGAEIVSQFVNVQVNETYANFLNIEKSKFNAIIKGVILYYSNYEIESLNSIKEVTKIFNDHLKASYYGNRKLQDSNILQVENIGHHIKTYPPTYITDYSSLNNLGKNLAKALPNRVTFFPNDHKYNNLPSQYHFYLEGNNESLDLKEAALENFNRTLTFINNLINE